MLPTMLWPREAGRYIAGKAKDVYISEKGVKSCANVIATSALEGKLDMDSFKQNEVLPLNRGLSKGQLVDWTFLVDSINFNFWTKKGEPKFTVTHNGRRRSGYLGMLNAVNRAIDEGKPMYDPEYYSKLSYNELKDIFRSDTKSSIPLFNKRLEIIGEVGNILIKKFNSSFLNVLNQAQGSALKLVEIVITEFPSFRDIHSYDGQEVAILKRAQILAADLALLYREKEPANFSDLDKLTMFADYRVPQSLVHFGVLSYSDNLMEKLKQEYLFNSGDKEEVEIRGTSIHAIELVVEETNRILKAQNSSVLLNTIKVDFFLWDYRIQNAKALDRIPYHKTRCIYY